jgi:PucR C-terminal helix-turn-helix domain/GGDEF-like domain
LCCDRSFRRSAGGRVRSAPTSARGEAAGSGIAVAELHERLLARKPDIEQAILTRVYAVSDPGDVADPTYQEGLRAAVGAAIDYGIAGIQCSERNPPPIPPVLLVQARVAARSGVGVDTVLRRYFAGYALLGDFLIEETQAGGVGGGRLVKKLLRAQASSFDRLLAAVTEEHRRDQRLCTHSSQRRRLEWVQRLLAGEMLDTAELAYNFDATHVGLVAQGPGAEDAIRKLAAGLDRSLLLVGPGEQTAWAWLGGSPDIDLEEVVRNVPAAPERLSLAIGEPGEDLAGWRLSHRQAAAAMPIAVRGPESFVRYADVALLASIVQDDLLVASLCQLYLDPLAKERDRGETAQETLRAYFASGRNVTSAAAALGVSRNTITNRIRVIEAAIGSPLTARATELEAALRLKELGSSGASHVAQRPTSASPPERIA